MKFIKELNQADDAQPPINKPVPMRPKTQPVMDEGDSLTDLMGVARKLGVSKRTVQELVSAKAIPVIRFRRRCVRFDLADVMAAIKRYEVKAVEAE